MNQYEPAFESNNIPICLSCDDNYFCYLTVTIQSIILHAKSSSNYDILILHSNLSEYKQLDFLSQVLPENFCIRFVCINTATNNLKLMFPKSKYLSAAYYYRILIPVLFSSYDKIIYLDCDLILNHDISEFFSIKLSYLHLIGAVPDLSIANEAKNSQKMMFYIKNRLKLTDEEHYINSGVLLLNIKQMNAEKTAVLLLQALHASLHDPFKFQDQDIINMICANRVFFIDFRWNFITDKINELSQINDEPYIIHYAGADKPWKDPSVFLSSFFWKIARSCRTYEQIIYKNCITPDIAFILFNNKKIKRKYIFYSIMYVLSRNSKYKQRKITIKTKLDMINKIF